MAKSYFYDESIADWRELVKGERGEDGATIIVNDETAQRAEAARDEAQSAATVAGGFDTRLNQIETMAGLEPGDVTDAQTANLISQENTLTNLALTSQIEDRAVTGVGVSRIIASVNPNYPIKPGELLVVLEPTTQFFYDFSDYDAGPGLPEDWINLWFSSNDWEIVGDSEGNFLRNNASNNLLSRRLIVPEATMETTELFLEQEVVFSWRAHRPDPDSHSYSYARGVVRASGEEGNENGYWAGHNNRPSSLGAYFEGDHLSTSVQIVNPVSTGVWYVTRLRAVGDTAYAKTWEFGQPEPIEWQAERTDPELENPGWVGLLANGRHTSDFGFIGIGLNGETAPMEPLP